MTWARVFNLWCPSFCGWLWWLVGGGTCIPGPHRTLLQRNVSQEAPTPRAPPPQAKSFWEGGLSAILELQVWHIYLVVTEWISGTQALDAALMPSLSLAPDCWCLSEKSLYIPLEPQVFATATQGHLYISWLGWPAGLTLMVLQDCIYFKYILKKNCCLPEALSSNQPE